MTTQDTTRVSDLMRCKLADLTEEELRTVMEVLSRYSRKGATNVPIGQRLIDAGAVVGS